MEIEERWFYGETKTIGGKKRQRGKETKIEEETVLNQSWTAFSQQDSRRLDLLALQVFFFFFFFFFSFFTESSFFDFHLFFSPLFPKTKKTKTKQKKNKKTKNKNKTKTKTKTKKQNKKKQIEENAEETPLIEVRGGLYEANIVTRVSIPLYWGRGQWAGEKETSRIRKGFSSLSFSLLSLSFSFSLSFFFLFFSPFSFF